MKFSVTISLIVVTCLLGCSPGGLSVVGTRCSGDLSSFLAQCITNRGGQPTSTNIPPIQCQWTYQFRPNEDIVLIQSNRFSELRSFLRQAYGDPDPSAGSSAVAPMGSGQSGTYGPKQIGVALNFTGDAKQTVICILGRYGSVVSPPNPQGGANGWQPVSSDTNATSAAAATRRSP
jgi:hypothetical protein